MMFKHVQSAKYAKQISYFFLFFLLTSPLVVYIDDIYQHKYFSILFLLLYTPALLFFSAQRFSVAPFIQKTIEAFGNLTYSSYLIHFPLQLVIALYFIIIEKEIPYLSEIFFVGFIFITLLASYYIYRLFELPARNQIRKSWLNSNKTKNY